MSETTHLQGPSHGHKKPWYRKVHLLTYDNDRVLTGFRMRVAVMTCVIFIGWIYTMFYSQTWTMSEDKSVGEVILGILYLPMFLVAMLLVAIPLQWMEASSQAIAAGAVIYGVIMSPLFARLCYRKWHGERIDYAEETEEEAEDSDGTGTPENAEASDASAPKTDEERPAP